MYRAFNLSKCNWDDISRESGASSYQQNNKLIRKSLESFLDNGILDGTSLRDSWFPPIKADVFISHSHDDLEDAIKCASWLKDEFDLEAFVDSSVWGHAKELQRSIDDEFCLNQDRETYGYDAIMRSTSHVHMMLVSALSAMLDSSECILFLNTPNSISSAKAAIAKTRSPWLFYELGVLRTLRRNKPRRLLLEEHNFSRDVTKSASLNIEYIVPLSDLTAIDSTQLNVWLEACDLASKKGEITLDLLYESHPEPK